MLKVAMPVMHSPLKSDSDGSEDEQKSDLTFDPEALVFKRPGETRTLNVR